MCYRIEGIQLWDQNPIYQNLVVGKNIFIRNYVDVAKRSVFVTVMFDPKPISGREIDCMTFAGFVLSP